MNTIVAIYEINPCEDTELSIGFTTPEKSKDVLQKLNDAKTLACPCGFCKHLKTYYARTLPEIN